MATDLPKRDESRDLPHVWIPMSTVDFLSHRSPRSVNVAWVDNHNVSAPTGEGHEYCPASELDASESARKLAVEEADYLRANLDDAMGVVREHLKLVRNMKDVHEALGVLSSQLGNGLGDESTTFGELIARISDGVDAHLRIAQDRINEALKRARTLESVASVVVQFRDSFDERPEMQTRKLDMYQAIDALASLLAQTEKADV